MKYLLDTHIFLWVLFDDNKLSEKVKEVIINFNNEIYVSIITYWEISLKYSIGKLKLVGITPDALPKQAQKISIETLNLSDDIVATFYRLPKIIHKDPFDRMITWQAINKNITLISKDKEIKDYKKFGLKIL
ncbi:MAG: type II toxin-antitoxin system VapC family toxin [bacterium]